MFSHKVFMLKDCCKRCYEKSLVGATFLGYITCFSIKFFGRPKANKWGIMEACSFVEQAFNVKLKASIRQMTGSTENDFGLV